MSSITEPSASRTSDSGPGFRSEYFPLLRAVEDRHFWFVARREIILQALSQAVPQGAKLGVLEVGCGTGNVIRHLREHTSWQLAGGDAFAAALRACWSGLNVPLIALDAACLPFRNCWDIIGMFDVLEHLQDDETVLRECWNSLKAGGRLVLTVPAHPALWSSFDELACHQRRYSQTELLAKLNRAGFVVERISHFMALLLPVVYVLRVLRDRLAPTEDAKHDELPIEFSPPALLNRILLGVLRLERRWLRFADLPFGSSLIALARKA